MDASRKKTILIIIASCAAVLLLAALGWYIYFQSLFSVYQDDQYRFSIKYPKTWKLVAHPYKNVGVAFARPKDTALDTIFDNFNVTIQPLPNDITSLDAFSATIKRQLTGVFKTIKITKDKPFQWGLREGHILVYEELLPSHLKMINAWVLRGDQAYILTFLGDLNKYSQSALVVNEMIRSLELQ
jgi:hypothetical protein